MDVPPQQPGPSRGPFGEKAFKGALIACAVLVISGLAMLGGGQTMAGVGLMFLSLGSLGLVTGGFVLLVERFIERRGPPPR
jgi:hypothetical protein